MMIFKWIFNISVYIYNIDYICIYIYARLYDFIKRCCTCSWSGVDVIIMVGWWRKWVVSVPQQAPCVGNHLGYFRNLWRLLVARITQHYLFLFIFKFSCATMKYPIPWKFLSEQGFLSREFHANLYEVCGAGQNRILNSISLIEPLVAFDVFDSLLEAMPSLKLT